MGLIGFFMLVGCSFFELYFLTFRLGSETSLLFKDSIFFFFSIRPPDFPLLPNYLSLLLMAYTFLAWGVFASFWGRGWFLADLTSIFLSDSSLPLVIPLRFYDYYSSSFSIISFSFSNMFLEWRVVWENYRSIVNLGRKFAILLLMSGFWRILFTVGLRLGLFCSKVDRSFLSYLLKRVGRGG